MRAIAEAKTLACYHDSAMQENRIVVESCMCRYIENIAFLLTYRATDDDDIDILAGIDVSVLNDEDRERIEAMVKATMDKIKDVRTLSHAPSHTYNCKLMISLSSKPNGFALRATILEITDTPYRRGRGVVRVRVPVHCVHISYMIPATLGS